MGYAEYVAECNADGPAITVEVDSGAAPPFPDAKAKSFNGTQAETVVAGTTPPYTYGQTIEFWARPTGLRNNPCAVSLQGLSSYADRQTLCYVGEATLATARSWTMGDTSLGYENDALADTWHHYVFTRSNAQFATTRLYVDGVQVDTGGSSDIFAPDHFRIGGNTKFGQYFVGSISQVRYYGKELSAARVLAHYDAAMGAAPEPIDIAVENAAQSTLSALAPAVDLGPLPTISITSENAAQSTLSALTPAVDLGPRPPVTIEAVPARTSISALAPSISLAPMQITVENAAQRSSTALAPTFADLTPYIYISPPAARRTLSAPAPQVLFAPIPIEVSNAAQRATSALAPTLSYADIAVLVGDTAATLITALVPSVEGGNLNAARGLPGSMDVFMDTPRIETSVDTAQIEVYVTAAQMEVSA